ncbi:hypothetical protein TNCV_3513661 [Trichonephila clavipes]|nr:hypothetical protein TNCV_3513661 [Trichonephila clavipes]
MHSEVMRRLIGDEIRNSEIRSSDENDTLAGVLPYKPSSRKSSREVGGRGKEVCGPWQPEGVLQNWGGNEPNRTVVCILLKAKANDRRHNLAFC